jgi:hypothetical protein
MEDVVIIYGNLVYFYRYRYGISFGHSLYFMVIWYIFARFGMLYQEKSGNPAQYLDSSFSNENYCSSKQITFVLFQQEPFSQRIH